MKLVVSKLPPSSCQYHNPYFRMLKLSKRKTLKIARRNKICLDYPGVHHVLRKPKNLRFAKKRCRSIAISERKCNFATSNMQIITMTYLNRFHKESVERCLRKVAESKSLQMNCEEEVRKIKEMHNQIAQRYPKGA